MSTNFLAPNYPQAQPAPNLISMLGGLLAAKQTQLQNTQIAGQQAANRLLAANTDNSGNLNYAGWRRDVGNNPVASVAMPQVAAQSFALQKGEADAQTAALQKSMQQVSTVNQTLQGVLMNGAQGGDLGSLLTRGLADLASRSNGTFTPAESAALMQEFNQIGANAATPQAKRTLQEQWLTSMVGRSEDASTLLNQAYGQTAYVDTGDGYMPVRMSAITGLHVVGPFIPKHLPPERLASPYQYFDTNTNHFVTIPWGQALTNGEFKLGPNGDVFPGTARVIQIGSNGNLVFPGSGASSGTATPPPAIPPPAPNGVPPPAMNNIPPPQAAQPTSRQGAPSGANIIADVTAPPPPAARVRPDMSQSSPALGQEAAANAMATPAGTASAAMLQNLDPNSGAPARIYQLQLAYNNLQNSVTGRGTETWQDITSVIQSLAPDVVQRALGITPNDAANQISSAANPQASRDMANKYLSRIAMSSMQSLGMGAGTDDKLAAAMGGNPNVHMNNLAALDLTRVMVGMERMREVEANAWAQSIASPSNPNGWDPSKFFDWQRQFVNKVNPIMFILPQLSPAQRNYMMKGMSVNQINQMVKDYKAFRNSSWWTGGNPNGG